MQVIFGKYKKYPAKPPRTRWYNTEYQTLNFELEKSIYNDFVACYEDFTCVQNT